MQSRFYFAKSEPIRLRVLINVLKHGFNRSFFTNHGINRYSPSKTSKSFRLQRLRQLRISSLLFGINGRVQIRLSTTVQSAVVRSAIKEEETAKTSLRSSSLQYLTDEVTLAGESSAVRIIREIYPSRRFEKSTRTSPSVLLARYLDSRSDSGAVDKSRQGQNLALLQKSSFNDLPAILLRYLIEFQAFQSHTEALAAALDHSTAQELQKLGFTPNDVHVWATIATAPTDEEAARLYLSMQCAKPAFLLLEILRRYRLSMELFRLLLIDAWRLLLGKQLTAGIKDFISPLFVYADSEKSHSVVPLASTLPVKITNNGRLLEDTAFTVLINRLLRHARQVWPPAVLSISHMIAIHFQRVAGGLPEEVKLKPELHSRLSKMLNMFIYRLSLPASLSPMNSMTYNWKAQRVLLELAGSFRPPLHLDMDSYRAVASVLAASPKSPKEAKFASLLRRTWPPWRKELDGMDVERSPEDDISRAVAAVSRMREAGYSEEPIDRAIQILGGREPDGTPTIQTRSLIRKRRSKSSRKNTPQSPARNVEVEWVARIRATRDIYEAWAAFIGYTASGHSPSHPIYEAMFEKLVFDYIARTKGYHNITVPGDGMEVMPVLDDNLSESEKRRLQPPTLDELYLRMRQDGIRPSGRCLSLLLSRATSLQGAFKYLQDGSALPSNAASTLLGSFMEMDMASLMRIPEPIFVASIRFLSQAKHDHISQSSSNAQRKSSIATDIYNHSSGSEALLHAFQLIKRRRCSSRPAWYALFGALARQGLELDNRKDQNGNDILSWQVLKAALYDSRQLGMQLDPAGFQMMCIGLQKALLASSHASDKEAGSVHTDHGLVKETFRNLGRSADPLLELPQLLQKWGGSHLHSYIRVLGMFRDVDEILQLLQWMVRHQAELKANAEVSNDTKLLRRCLIAIRAFYDKSGDVPCDVVDEIRRAVELLEGWGGWPTAEELDEYQTKNN